MRVRTDNVRTFFMRIQLKRNKKKRMAKKIIDENGEYEFPVWRRDGSEESRSRRLC